MTKEPVYKRKINLPYSAQQNWNEDKYKNSLKGKTWLGKLCQHNISVKVQQMNANIKRDKIYSAIPESQFGSEYRKPQTFYCQK